jgi:hypothetical protein
VAVEWSLQKASARTESTLALESVEASRTEEGMERRGTVLDADDLPKMTVAALHTSCGGFLKVHTASNGAAAAPTTLPSAFSEMMEARLKAQQQLMRPTPPTGDRFDFRLQRALLLHLEQQGLGFSSVEVNTSGADLLRLLAEALQ